MRKTLVRCVLAALVVLLALPLAAQDATPAEQPTTDGAAAQATPMDATPSAGGMATAGEAEIVINDQFVLNGFLLLERVVSPGPGFVAVHVNLDGAPGPLVGITPVQAGENNGQLMLIDTGGATPSLLAMLHNDDMTVGVFEYGKIPGADQPVTTQGVPFRISALTAFPHQPTDGSVVIASAILETPGWVVIHGDEAGQPGQILGQAPINAGTNTPVIVPIATDTQPTVIFPMLYTDDGQMGTFEFGTVEGADLPVTFNDMSATLPIQLTETPTVLTAAGIQVGDGMSMPTLQASDQALTGADGAQLAAESPTAMLMIDSASMPVQGWVDVHADGGGHPGKSLGMSPLPAGEASGIPVELNPMMQPVSPLEVTQVVWPMLHVDDANPGIYDYLMIPGADLPVVVNGRIMAMPVNVTGGEMVRGMPMDGTGMGVESMATPGAAEGDMGQITATPAG